MEENQLVDIWRERNPSEKQFTWIQRENSKFQSASRLDFFIINLGLSSMIEAVNRLYDKKCTNRSCFNRNEM